MILCGLALVLIGMVSVGLAESATAVSDLGTAPGDGLRILAVDTSAFPDITARVALPVAAGELPDVSANFSVSSAGVVVPASVKRLARDPLPLAILLDTAAGTATPTIAAEQAAVGDLLRQLDPSTAVVIGTSSGGVIAGPGTDRERSLTAVAHLRSGGDRNWPKAVLATLAASGKASHCNLVVVSTGASSGTSKQPTSLAANLAAHVVKTHWLSLGSDAAPVGALREIQSVSVASADGLAARFDSIAAELGTRYRLTFRVDARATAAAVTLVTKGGAWTTETPLAFSSPALAPLASTRAVASRTSTGKSRSPSRAARASTFFRRNWKFLGAGFVAALFLGMAFSVVSVSKTPPPRHRSRGTALKPSDD